MNPCPTCDLCFQVQPSALSSAILLRTTTSILNFLLVSWGVPAPVEAPFPGDLCVM